MGQNEAAPDLDGPQFSRYDPVLRINQKIRQTVRARRELVDLQV